MLKRRFREIPERPHFVLNDTLRTYCCSKEFGPGDVIELRGQTSPNRLFVYDASSGTGLHKVKRSSFNRVTGANIKKNKEFWDD